VSAQSVNLTPPAQELLQYLPQLVQALRYEPATDPPQPVGTAPHTVSPTAGLTVPGAERSPFAALLIQRAAANPTLSSYFHWYLAVAASGSPDAAAADAADPGLAEAPAAGTGGSRATDMFMHVHAQFQWELQQTPGGRAVLEDLSAQARLMTRLQALALELRKISDRQLKVRPPPLLSPRSRC
jgi:hypothetical protein